MLAIGVHITFHIHFGTSIAQCPLALMLIAQNAMPEWGEDGTADGAAQQHAEATQASVADAAVPWNTDNTIMVPSTEFDDIVSAELATIAANQCWPDDALASPFSFMDIWARSNNGEGSAVRDGLALIILRELQTSVDEVAFQNIVDRADFFVVPGNVPGEKELIFASRVRLAFFKVCRRLQLPYFMSQNVIATKKRGRPRPKRGTKYK